MLDIRQLEAPHIARAWFLELDLPDGPVRMHSGTGRVDIGGHTWTGVTDPIGRQLVGIDAVEEPRFGQAVAVNIVMSGVNREFFREVHRLAREMEGRKANIYFAVFDAETERPWEPGLIRMFPGRISSPALRWEGIGVRTIAVTIESLWSSQNYQFGGKWTDGDQRRRYPGDKGLQYVGVKVYERWG